MASPSRRPPRERYVRRRRGGGLQRGAQRRSLPLPAMTPAASVTLALAAYGSV